MKTRRFKVKNSLPLGGRKDRIIVQHEKDHCVTPFMWEDVPSETCVYNPLDPRDKNFFMEIFPDPPVPFAIGMSVIVKTDSWGKIVKSLGSKNITPGKVVRLPLWTQYKIVRYDFANKANNVVISYNNIEYATNSKNLYECKTYWFINSSGIVCNAILGKDPNADRYRGATLNAYATSEEANRVLKSII